MKKLLYGSTALIAVGMMATGATAANKIKMNVGGYFQAFMVFISEDLDATTRNHKIAREAEIIFSGSTTLDNGLKVGAQVQLEAENCGDQIDESFIFFSGKWGRINLGSENSAAYLMHYGSPSPSVGHGLNSPNFSHPATGGSATAKFPTTRLQLTSDSEKITYFTPRMGGFQFGISYTPDNSEANGIGAFFNGSYSGAQSDTNGTTGADEAIEVGANYIGKFAGMAVRVSAAYGSGSGEAPGVGDATEWSVGYTITTGGLTSGAGYRSDDQGNSAVLGDRTDINVGVRYARGAWGIGIQFSHIEQKFRAGGADLMDSLEIGGTYALGPGVTLGAGVQFHTFDNLGSGGANNDATIVFIGTSLSF